MKHLFYAIDDQLQSGTLTRVAIFVIASVVLLAHALVAGDNMLASLLFVMIGLTGAGHEYRVWLRRRRQRGLDLIGTTENIEG